MKEGAVLFYTNKKVPMFTAIVQAVTGCKMTHVIIYSKGKYYESVIKTIRGRVFSGVHKCISVDAPSFIHIYKRDLTDIEAIKLNQYLESQIGKLYNLFLLLNMIWIYSLRWLWKLIKRCPFDDKAFGHICSVLIDRAYKYIGIDLIPEQLEDYTTPCDLWRSIELVYYIE